MWAKIISTLLETPLKPTLSMSVKSATEMQARLLMVAILLALTALMGMGCASKSEAGTDVEPVDLHQEERARNGNLSRDGLDVRQADLNGDDLPDQWTFFDADGNVVRIERDLNFNGQVDMWLYYDADGRLIEEEMDLDLDGLVDVVVFYSEGRIVRKMLATGFDGRFTIQKFYDSSERLLRVERDSSGDGAPDVWEYYENGNRVRVGWDTTGDGRADTFDQF